MINNIYKLSFIFYKIASGDYKKYKEKIEEYSKKNPYPFSNWFDSNGRTYIDYNYDSDSERYNLNDDLSVINFLKKNRLY